MRDKEASLKDLRPHFARIQMTLNETTLASERGDFRQAYRYAREMEGTIRQLEVDLQMAHMGVEPAGLRDRIATAVIDTQVFSGLSDTEADKKYTEVIDAIVWHIEGKPR